MKGVSDQFLKILDLERRRAWRAIALGLAVIPIAYFMAELADVPRLGSAVWTYAGALALGVGVGAVYAWWRSTRLARSLKDAWAQWMRMSLSCTRVDEIYYKVQDRDPPRGTARSLGVALVVFANLVLFALLWSDPFGYATLGLAVALVDGIALGAILGRAAFLLGWAHRFLRALHELVQERAIGVWGER